MGSAGNPPIIHYDYEFSPIGQKTKLLLTAAGVNFERVDQPPVLPRKDLEALGITYRRIPLLAIGKDVYCDSAMIFNIVLKTLAKGNISTTASDKAWEAWGYKAFEDALMLAPVALLTDDFVKDRETIFPILARSDYKTLRPSGVADLQSRMAWLEEDVLTNSHYIGGGKLSVADIQAIWGIRWALRGMDQSPPGLGAESEPGVGKKDFPKVWNLIENLPTPTAETISADDAAKKIQGAQYTSDLKDVMQNDATGIKAGTKVTIDSLDSAPHSHPQSGKLIATARNEIVVELDSGIHLHFPREGYILREA